MWGDNELIILAEFNRIGVIGVNSQRFNYYEDDISAQHFEFLVEYLR